MVSEDVTRDWDRISGSPFMQGGVLFSFALSAYLFYEDGRKRNREIQEFAGYNEEKYSNSNPAANVGDAIESVRNRLQHITGNIVADKKVYPVPEGTEVFV